MGRGHDFRHDYGNDVVVLRSRLSRRIPGVQDAEDCQAVAVGEGCAVPIRSCAGHQPEGLLADRGEGGGDAAVTPSGAVPEFLLESGQFTV